MKQIKSIIGNKFCNSLWLHCRLLHQSLRGLMKSWVSRHIVARENLFPVIDLNLFHTSGKKVVTLPGNRICGKLTRILKGINISWLNPNIKDYVTQEISEELINSISKLLALVLWHVWIPPQHLRSYSLQNAKNSSWNTDRFTAKKLLQYVCYDQGI